MDIPRADGECAGAGGFCKDNQCLFFFFPGQGEEMRVLRLRHLLRIYIQELLVVTEPGTIHVKADSVGSVTGTPQNDALQKWKEGREKKQEAYHFIRTGLRNATGKDSLHLIQIRDSLRMQEQEANFLFLKEQGTIRWGHSCGRWCVAP